MKIDYGQAVEIEHISRRGDRGQCWLYPRGLDHLCCALCTFGYR